MKSERVRGGWIWVFLPVILMLVGSNIAWGIFFAVMKDPAEAGMETFRTGPLIWSLLQVILFFIAIGGLKSMGISFFRIAGFRREYLLDDLKKAIPLAIAGVLLILFITHAIGSLIPDGDGGPEFYPWALVWWTTAGSITAGVGEEVYFRGFLMERLSWMNNRWLILITAISFALWHVNPLLFPHTFLIGAAFGYLYLRWKRLFPLILSHVFMNMMGGILMMMGIS